MWLMHAHICTCGYVHTHLMVLFFDISSAPSNFTDSWAIWSSFQCALIHAVRLSVDPFVVHLIGNSMSQPNEQKYPLSKQEVIGIPVVILLTFSGDMIIMGS